MTLSKKNTDKLKSISINNDLSKQKIKPEFESINVNSDNPNDIFYSIIDNSNDINETTLPNKRLKENEEKLFTSNNEKFNSKQHKNNKRLSIQLTEEDILYDEFNYLLDEE